MSELARLYPMSFAAVQKHVAVLADAGLIAKRRHGREQGVRGEVGRIHDVHRLLDELEAAWRDRLDRFGAVFADDLATTPAQKLRASPSWPRPHDRVTSALVTLDDAVCEVRSDRKLGV